jgi:hypothetical protein
MVSGSVAMLAYSVPRMTRDIDIILEIGEGGVDRFVAQFEKDFYAHKTSVIEEVKRRGMFNFIDTFLDKTYIAHWCQELNLDTFNLL